MDPARETVALNWLAHELDLNDNQLNIDIYKDFSNIYTRQRNGTTRTGLGCEMGRA